MGFVGPDPLEKTCPFKKHQGKKWRQVLKDDPDYVKWLLNGDHSIELANDLYEALLAERPDLYVDDDDDYPY